MTWFFFTMWCLQGLLHLQRLHQHAHMHATTATSPKQCDAKAGTMNAPSSAADGIAGTTRANSAALSMHGAPGAPVATVIPPTATTADANAQPQDPASLPARTQVAAEEVSTGVATLAPAAVTLGMPALPVGVPSTMNSGAQQGTAQTAVVGNAGLAAGTPVSLMHAMSKAPVATSAAPTGFPNGTVLHQAQGVAAIGTQPNWPL